jgi:hypothetical protein
MGYRHTDNLYANQAILQFPECYASEKIHGTSSHLKFNRQENTIHYHGGGERYETFKALFDVPTLEYRFPLLRGDVITVYGESYGGKQQKNAWRYGPVLKFCAFEVNVDGVWLTVPQAEEYVKLLGLEFVHYVRIKTDLSCIDAERDAISEQAIRNGVTTRDGEFIRREGVVLRTINEELDSRGNRVMAKHKRPEERETKTIREVSTDKIEKQKEARAIAEEWVTENRISNAKSHFTADEWRIQNMGNLIRYIVNDVIRESEGLAELDADAKREVGKRSAQLIKQDFQSALAETTNA